MEPFGLSIAQIHARNYFPRKQIDADERNPSLISTVFDVYFNI